MKTSKNMFVTAALAGLASACAAAPDLAELDAALVLEPEYAWVNYGLLSSVTTGTSTP